MREAMMEELVKEVQEIAGEEYELTVSEKRKNNGTVYTAVEVYKKDHHWHFVFMWMPL